eukprot:1386112-Rhodomonas_salina.1
MMRSDGEQAPRRAENKSRWNRYLLLLFALTRGGIKGKPALSLYILYREFHFLYLIWDPVSGVSEVNLKFEHTGPPEGDKTDTDSGSLQSCWFKRLEKRFLYWVCDSK